MKNHLKKHFDFVGTIDVKTYIKEIGRVDILGAYESIFVVGLSYPHEALPQKKDKLIASLYTYGYDYHIALERRIKEALKDFDDYLILVDNHDIDERRALELTGLAYRGKNNLMIHKDYGSYFFIGLILSKRHYEEEIVENTDSCKDCTKCIQACPVGALNNGYDVLKCISAYNQSKRSLTDEEIKHNYLLLGCDICQRVCPKNTNIKTQTHHEFIPNHQTYVDIEDLFILSNKAFLVKYGDKSYLWRGKTLLLRNALTILLKQKNTAYNHYIKDTLNDQKYPEWYRKDAKRIYEKLLEVSYDKHRTL